MVNVYKMWSDPKFHHAGELNGHFAPQFGQGSCFQDVDPEEYDAVSTISNKAKMKGFSQHLPEHKLVRAACRQTVSNLIPRLCTPVEQRRLCNNSLTPERCAGPVGQPAEQHAQQPVLRGQEIHDSWFRDQQADEGDPDGEAGPWQVPLMRRINARCRSHTRFHRTGSLCTFCVTESRFGAPVGTRCFCVFCQCPGIGLCRAGVSVFSISALGSCSGVGETRWSAGRRRSRAAPSNGTRKYPSASVTQELCLGRKGESAIKSATAMQPPMSSLYRMCLAQCFLRTCTLAL